MQLDRLPYNGCSALLRVHHETGGKHMFDYADRRTKLMEALASAGIDALFLGPGADLEYLTGLERGIPNFGNISYAHGWVTGAFFQPGSEPLFILPRMVVEFHLPHGAPGELVVVNETDDG